MTANQQPNREPTLTDVINRLDKLTQKLEQTQKWQEQSQGWQDRTWDVVKWVGGISAGLSVSAAVALLGLAIRSVWR